MNLLIDIGNTRIKWCVDENGAISSEHPINYKQVDFVNDIQQSWVKISAPEVLAVSSVSTPQIKLKIIELAKQLWPKVKVISAKSSAIGFSVTNAYQQPLTLGVDRWLGLIALQHYYPGNSCLIDCGTATTIDCINDKGLHLGGLICPGIQLMKQSLSQGTEDLSLTHEQYPIGLADCTEAAIYTGALFATVGLIEKTLKQFCHCQTQVLTGGNAELVAEYLEKKSIIEPDIILKGLSLFCREEKS